MYMYVKLWPALMIIFIFFRYVSFFPLKSARYKLKLVRYRGNIQKFKNTGVEDDLGLIFQENYPDLCGPSCLDDDFSIRV